MVDITIRGAGIFGLSIAWECLKRGASVRVIDPNGVGAGASGGLLGALAPHVPENWNEKKARQFDSLMAAESFWADVAIWAGIETSYGRLGRIQPLQNERAVELARSREQSARELWQGKASWRVCGAAELGAFVPHSETGLFVHDTLSARMFPRQACKALAAAIVARGGLLASEAAGEGKTIWATGVHDLERMSAQLNKPVGNAVKGQGALLAFDAQSAPQVFADAVHIVPHWDGTVAIGSTSEREFDEPFNTDEKLEAVLEKAFEALPQLRKARVLERWAGLRPRAKSRAPMLGAHPIEEGAFIANGGFKIGFGMAGDVARMMAELALNGQDCIPDEFRTEASL